MKQKCSIFVSVLTADTQASNSFSSPPSLPPSLPLGSGKSSLLNALAGRVSFIKGAKLEGELSVNGAPVEYGVVRRLCAYVVQVGREGGREGGSECNEPRFQIYVAHPPFFPPSLPPSLPPQDDVLYSFLTVQETLTLATHFYLPNSLSEEDKTAYVRDVINALGLAKAANTIIGAFSFDKFVCIYVCVFPSPSLFLDLFPHVFISPCPPSLPPSLPPCILLLLRRRARPGRERRGAQAGVGGRGAHFQPFPAVFGRAHVR